MRKFFSSQTGKRVLIGSGIIFLGVVLGFWRLDLLKSDSSLMRTLYFVISLGTGAVGLLYMLTSWKALLYGFGYLLFISLSLTLPDPWNRYFVFAAILCAIAVPPAIRYLRGGKKLPGKAVKVPNPEQIQKRRAQHLAWMDLQKGKMPLLVVKKSVGAIYQVFFQGGAFLFYKVGNFFQDLDESKLLQQENLPPLGQSDFQIVANDVTLLRFQDVYADENPFDLEISIYLRKKRHFLAAMRASGGEALEKLLREHIPKNAQMERKPVSHFVPSLNRERRKILRWVFVGVCAFATLADLSWLFLDVPYKLFAWLALLPTPMLLSMHYLFPHEVTLAEEKKLAYKRIMVFFPLMLLMLPPILRVDLDFNLISQGRWLLLSGIVLVALMVQAFFLSEESRKRKIQLLTLAFVLGAYAMALTALTNVLLDRTPPQEKTGVVQRMHIDVNSKAPTHYKLDLEFQDHEPDSLDVSEDFYRGTEIGDSVNVLFYEGAYGIRYAKVEEQP